MIDSVFIILEVNTPNLYRGIVKSVWIYYEDVIYELENVMGANRVDTKGLVYAVNGKFYRVVEKNLYKQDRDRYGLIK